MTTPDPATLEIGEELGSGAVAVVHRVRDRQSGRSYAGKRLHASHGADPGAVARFGREGEVIRDVVHPNVVQMHGTVQLEGGAILLMELVEGPSLAELIARHAPLGRDRLVPLARGVAAGLAAAHAAGVVHRDLKPANILVTDDDIPKIADFGMARATSFAGVDARAFAVLGTPDYMAPESVDPLAVGPRSDLYALGCIMLEMATGQPPFRGATPFAVMQAHRDAPPPELPANYGPQLGRLVAALLAKSPADRPASATAVVETLDRLGQTALATRDTPVPARAGRCARCGAPVVSALPVCLDCSLPQAHLEAGDQTLFVTGPGERNAKMDSALRDRLLTWARENESMGLDPAPLAKFIPRLPFPFVVGISRRSAEGIRRSLEALGFETELAGGGRLALPAIRKKATALGGRAAMIVLGSMAYMMSQAGYMWITLPIGTLGAFLVTGWQALRPVTRRTGEGERVLPATITERLDRIARLGPALHHRRHRESLRSATQRAVSLAGALGTDDPMLEAEVGQALDVALVATGRMDAIDHDLVDADLREASGQTHALLHERDTWAARLLELEVTLESLRGRLALAGARKDRATAEDELAELRARIEALEEVSEVASP